MSYSVRRWWGQSVRDLPTSEFEAVLRELKDADEEHGDVSLCHQSGWCLSYGRRRTLIFEDVNAASSDACFHQNDVAMEQALALWLLLSRGDVEGVRRAVDWQPGY